MTLKEEIDHMSLLNFRALSLSAVLLASASISAPQSHLIGQAQAAASEQEQAEALTFFTAMSEEAFAVLRNSSLTKDEQKVEFRNLFKKVTAVEIVGDFLIGYTKKKFSADQLERYTALLPDYVVALYTDRLIEVGNEEVTILNTYTQSQDTWIITRVTSPFGGDDLRADWRIRKLDDGQFIILDVKVENISLGQTKKAEFMSYISNRGVESFIKRLEADAAKSAA